MADATTSGQATVTVTSGSSVAVSVSPTAPTVVAGDAQQFTATVTGTSNTAVTRSVSETGGGTVSSTGLYTAPSAAGSYHVKATSVADTTKFGQATVTVTSGPPPITVAITPNPASTTTLGHLDFMANVTGTTSTAVTSGANPNQGLYIAPGVKGTHVRAELQTDPSKFDVVPVTVELGCMEALPQISRVGTTTSEILTIGRIPVKVDSLGRPVVAWVEYAPYTFSAGGWTTLGPLLPENKFSPFNPHRFIRSIAPPSGGRPQSRRSRLRGGGRSVGLVLLPLDGRIQLRGLLGAGGMGEVHRGWDARLERPVAVKFVLGPDPRGEERLLLEARLQARVEHPQVVQVHEVGTLQGRPCIILQLVEGRSLSLIAPSLGVEEKIELLRQAATGVHAAHRQGLVHRDVKPGNVLVEELASGRRALVSDFGLARADDTGLSRTGQPGTLDFMSPEQLLGPGPADHRSDIYALGATLYATLAGHPPFHTESTEEKDQRQLLQRIAEDDPPPLPASVPRELSLIAARAMRKEPGERYPTAEAFADDLSRFQRGEPILARPPTLGTRAWKWGRRNRGLARALAVAVAAVLLAAGHALWTTRRATLAALEAARLGALAESMEAGIRMEYLSPPHDLRPGRTRLREDVEALRAGAERSAPASFALGKGLLLLGDLEGARTVLQRAWDAGLQTPEVAEALGNALGGLYRQARELALDTLPPGARRDDRLRALQSELRDPAVRMLARGGVSGWRADWLAARVALLEEDFASAREHTRRVLAAEPSRYEALGVEAESWLGEAVQHSLRDEGDAALSALEHADAALTRAVDSGRSDPALAADVIQLHAERMQQLTKQSRPLEAENGRLSAALDRLAALDPDDPRPLMQRGDALLRKAQNALPPDTVKLTEEASRLFRRATELRPTDPRPPQRLGAAATLRAYALQELGQLAPALAAAREGRASLDRSAALAPMSARTELGRMMLLGTEAGILRRKGQPCGEALRAALAAGELCMELDPRRIRQVRADMCQTLVELGREEWLEGKDPLPSVRRGLELGEQAGRPGPRERARLASVYDLGASLAVSVGADHVAWQSRALSLVDETLASIPDHTDSLAIKAEVLAESAWYGVQRGEDPRRRVVEAARWIARAAAAGERGAELNEARALLPLSEASWLLFQGLDPTPTLTRAEQQLTALVSERPDDVTARALLAESAVVRASFLKRGGRPHVEEAHRGLGLLDEAVKLQPRDPSLWVIRARLQGLADDPERARESLSHALEMNPLVRAGREAVLARAELAR